MAVETILKKGWAQQTQMKTPNMCFFPANVAFKQWIVGFHMQNRGFKSNTLGFTGKGCLRGFMNSGFRPRQRRKCRLSRVHGDFSPIKGNDGFKRRRLPQAKMMDASSIFFPFLPIESEFLLLNSHSCWCSWQNQNHFCRSWDLLLRKHFERLLNVPWRGRISGRIRAGQSRAN